jgi:RNA 2',3'-cyclic 3'-phosphodiesterase
VRLFVAVPAEAPLRSLLERSARPAPGVRWLPADGLHLTVHFLGDVDDASLPELTAALTGSCAEHPAFTLRLERIGPAPPRRPRMVWAWLTPDERLSRLAAAVAGAAAPYAPRARPPRTDHPHLTLARLRPGRPPAGLPDHPLGGQLPVEACRLVSSRLSPSGAVYTERAALPLAPAD